MYYIFIYMYTVPVCQNESVTCSFKVNFQKIKIIKIKNDTA